jgi:hypothetical protein
MDLADALRLQELLGSDGVPDPADPYAQAVRDYVAATRVEMRPLPHTPNMPAGARQIIEDYEPTYQAQPCPICLATGRLPDDLRFGEHAGTECAVCFASGWIPTVAACRKVAQRSAEMKALATNRVEQLKVFIERASTGTVPDHVEMIRQEDGTHIELTDIAGDPVQAAMWEQALGDARDQLLEMADLEYHLTLAASSNERRYESIRRLRGKLRQIVRAWDMAAEAQATLEAATAPREDEHARCRTPGCRKPPKVWDAEGRGWCRPHAHRRGLLQRDTVPADE